VRTYVRMASLTETQRSVILGTMLGDGAMRCKRNALLEINHSAKQRAYVDWKFGVLRDLVATSPAERKSGHSRRAYRFVTRSLSGLTPIYKLFYRDGKKRVPELLLDPLILAVWFMDDGSRSYKTYYLNTQQFDRTDQERLVAMLGRQFNLRAYLNRDKSYLRIRLSVESARRFREIVRPHILTCFEYKLGA